MTGRSRRRSRAAYRGLLRLDFDLLLLAHGAPILSGGHDALAAFASSQG